MRLLRKIRSYPNDFFYYFVIFTNLLLRLSFIMTLSAYYYLWISPILLVSLTSLLEIYRRAQWNFLRVELEHIKLLKDFQPINGFKLPYKFDLDFMNNKEDKEFMKNILQTVLVEKKGNREVLFQTDGPNLNYQIEVYKNREKKLNKSFKKNNKSVKYSVRGREPECLGSLTGKTFKRSSSPRSTLIFRTIRT